MANRGLRGGSPAALYASRQTDEIEMTEEENPGPDITVIEDEPEPQDEPQPVVIEEPEPEPEPKEPDAVADLQRQLDALRGQNAELQTKVAAGENSELVAQQAIIAAGLNTAKAALKDAKAAYAAHAAAGEWDKAADAQEVIAIASRDVDEFQAGADEIKQLIARPKPKAPAKPAANADPFEASIADISEPSKEWCRKNKADLTRSPTRGNRALLAHQEALEEGIKPDTAEYFAFLDKQMGYSTSKEPTVSKTTSKTAKPVGQPRVAAPSGGRVPPKSNGGGIEVRLSKEEVAIAKTMGMSTKEYAAQKQEILRNGQDNSRSGPRFSADTAANRR
jgi:hypothetical protein